MGRQRAHARLGLLFAAFCVVLPLLPACGYSLHGTRNPLLESAGVKRVMVRPLVNQTYKPGVESWIYSQLVRVLATYKRLEIVGREEEADAFLEGTVSQATMTASALTPVYSLSPTSSSVSFGTHPARDVTIASEYVATLNCDFRLSLKGGRVLWSSGFGRSKSFPALNQLDVPGTTAALINESEFDRTLKDIAGSMMHDVHENMLGMF